MEIAKSEGLLLNERCQYFGLYDKEKMIGFCGILIKWNSAVMKCSYVAKYYRGNNYLELMIKHRIEYLKSIGIKDVSCNCTKMSLKTHVRMGASPVKEYKNGVTKVVYENIS